MSERQRLVLEVLGDGRLRSRSVRGQVIAPFKEEAALAIARLFTEAIEFEHGLRPASDRDSGHTLEQLDWRLRREILSGEQALLLDELCATHGSALDIIVQGPPALLNLPLETLRHEMQFLSYHNISLARTLPSVHRACSRLQDEEQNRLRVLLVPAQPTDQGPIQWDDTLFEMERNLWHFRRFAAVDWVEPGRAEEFRTWERLRRLMDGQRDPFDVVVFFAHGRCVTQPQIALVGAEGRAQWHTVEQLLPALTCGARLPRLVVLACCHLARMEPTNPFSGFAYQLLQHGVPTVLSMQAAVSTRAAAVAVASVCRSILQGKSIGKAVLECRRRMDREGVLPALWLHPHCHLDRPLVRLTPTPPEQLVEQAREAMASVLDVATVEKMFAALQCLDDLDPVLAAHERPVREFFAERWFMAALERLERDRTGERRERVAEGILTLEDRCPELAHREEGLPELRRWVQEPLAKLLTAGLTCEPQKKWEQAATLFQQAVELPAEGYHVERLWRDLRTRAHRHQRLSLAQNQLAQAETLWSAGEREPAREGRAAALEELTALLANYPKEFPYLTGLLETQRRTIRAQELALTTEELAQKGEWGALVEALEQARKECPEIVDASLLAAAQEGKRLLQVATAARQLAAKRKWLAAAQLLREQGRLGVHHPHLDAWWKKLKVERATASWEDAAAVDEALARLLEGVSVASADPAWAAAPLDSEGIEKLRLAFTPGPDCRGQMAEQLGWDAPLFHALDGDWPAARAALGHLLTARQDFNPAVYHQLVVAGLAQCDLSPLAPYSGRGVGGEGRSLAESEAPHPQPLPEAGRGAEKPPLRFGEGVGGGAAWVEVLTHWATLATCADYWRDWLREHSQQAKAPAFVSGLRRQLAGWLSRRAEAGPLLLSCEKQQTLSPAEAGELVALGLEVGELALHGANWTQLRSVWSACLHLANRADSVPSTSLRIFHTCTQHALPPRGERELELLGRLVQLHRLMQEVLQGTPQAGAAAEELAGLLVLKGLTHVDQGDYADCLMSAQACFEEAHNLQPSETTAAGLVLGLGLLAEDAEDDTQRQYLSEAARDIVNQALLHWPGDQLLLLASEWLCLHGGRNDIRFRHFIAAMTRQGRISPQGVVTADAVERARLALEQGHHADAVRFLLAALGEGRSIEPELVQQAFAAWTAPLFAARPGADALPDLELVREQLRALLKYLPDPDLLELQRRLDEVALWVASAVEKNGAS